MFTTTERRPRRVRAAVTPDTQPLGDGWIPRGIARRTGFAGLEWESAKDVFDELCSVSTTCHGLDRGLVPEGRHHWPVPQVRLEAASTQLA